MRVPNWSSDANGRCIISIDPAIPPYAALIPNATALYRPIGTPIDSALASLSRIATSARPGRLRWRLRASRNSTAAITTDSV